MKGRRWAIVSGIVLTAVLGALLLNLSWAGAGALAQTTATPAATNGATLARTVTVVGEGSVRIKPDMATTSIGVETVGDTVRGASGEAAEIMEAVLAALKKQGIADRDMQTSGYSIWVERPGMTMEERSTENAIYHVNNNVNVTIRDLDRVSAVLDAAIGAGANQIYGVTFGLEDPKVMAADARSLAVEDALAKATELCELNGVEIGQVVSISEVVGGNGGYFTGNFSERSAIGLGGGGAGPVNPGELVQTMQLQVTYEIQ
ncbi:MAG: SIMPL domain-containing protein [Anaerolineae bacterium]